MPIKDINITTLQKSFDDCGKNYPTLKSMKTTVKQLYQYAMKYDIINKDYSIYIDIQKYKDKNPNARVRTIFKKSEIDKLWEYADEPFVQTILVLIYTGTRISELLELKKANINMEKQVFDVVDSKTESGIRVVPIADKIKPFFEQWMNSDSEYLWHKSDGTKISYENYRDTYWDPLMIRFKFTHTPHDTRHTCVSMLASKKVEQTTIKKIVGHRGAMLLTERVYTHLDINELLEAINKI